MIIERNGRKWHWPESDQKLIQVFDWVEDIQKILPYLSSFRNCIQAGGAMGQWPVEFSQYFEQVFTFEPHPGNFEYLEKNIEGINNITAYPWGLSNKTERISMHLDDCESGNSGAYYIKPGGSIKAIMSVEIDRFKFDNIDLIQLDVEGYEAEALEGAKNTILKYKPVIVIEEKALPHLQDFTRARRLLESWGYKEAEKIHRDVIFIYGK